MGKPVYNPPKPVVRVKCSPANFNKVLILGLAVQAGLTGHAGFYPTPLITPLGVAITDLQVAIAALGTKHNKGGKANVNICINKTRVLYDQLVILAYYVQNIVSATTSPSLQAVQIGWSGFATKSKKSKIDSMQFPTFCHQLNTKKYPFTLRILKFKKPLGLFTGSKPPAYNVYAVLAGVKTLIATPTKTIHTVTAPGTYYVAPLSSSGEGNGQTIVVK